MSLPGRWTDDPAPVPPTLPARQPPKAQRQFQRPNYSDPAVTQFCNEHLNDLDDLQNVDQLITSLNEQQTVVTEQVVTSCVELTR
jgi:hypothetical protein